MGSLVKLKVFLLKTSLSIFQIFNLVEKPLICIILPAAMSLQQLPSNVVFSFVSLMVLHISGNTFGQGDQTTLRGGSLSLYITRYLS